MPKLDPTHSRYCEECGAEFTGAGVGGYQVCTDECRRRLRHRRYIAGQVRGGLADPAVQASMPPWGTYTTLWQAVSARAEVQRCESALHRGVLVSGRN